MNFQGFVDTIKENNLEVYGIQVFHKGEIVCSWQEEPMLRHPIYSATKSILSLAVGMARDDGKFDIDASIYEYLKSEIPVYAGKEQVDNLKKITVKCLLTMSVQGYPFRPEGDDWLEYSLLYPLENVEEKNFDYSNIPAYLVGVAVAKALGVHLYDYLEERLFDPLGIVKPTYQNCPSGYFYGASGMFLTVPELAKIGQLCLQNGMFEGQRLVSEAYINEATSIQQMNREGGYGYFFWKYKDGYRISGKWGQRSFVFPEKDMVITYLSNNGSGEVTEAMEKFILQ